MRSSAISSASPRKSSSNRCGSRTSPRWRNSWSTTQDRHDRFHTPCGRPLCRNPRGSPPRSSPAYAGSNYGRWAGNERRDGGVGGHTSVYGSAAGEQPAREVHELGPQQWLERHACTELVQLGGDGIVERVVASDDGHWRVVMPLIRAQPPKKFDAVGGWHPEVDKNRIRTARLHGTHPAFRRERCPRLKPLQTEHLRQKVGGRAVIVHDEHGGRQRRCTRDSSIVSSALSRRPALKPPAHRRYSSTGLRRFSEN